jgi:hypothetical protein
MAADGILMNICATQTLGTFMNFCAKNPPHRQAVTVACKRILTIPIDRKDNE